MNQLLDFFRSIPDVVWSGVIASVLTLSGVLISNRNNTSRLRIQLKHDSDEKSQERTVTLRREVYLKTFAEFVKANNHLTSLPMKNPTKENLSDGFLGFFVACSQMQLVAETKTAFLVNSLQADYSALILRVLSKVQPLHQISHQISTQDDLYNRATSQVNRVLAEMTNFNEAARVDPTVFSALEQSFDGFQSQVEQHAAQREQAWIEFNRLNIEYCSYVTGEIFEIDKKHASVFLEARRDLGLSSDLDNFHKQIEDNSVNLQKQLEIFLKGLIKN